MAAAVFAAKPCCPTFSITCAWRSERFAQNLARCEQVTVFPPDEKVQVPCNIVIHGKKVPVILDDFGLVKMPALKTESMKGEAWNDRSNVWADIKSLLTSYVADSCDRYYTELLTLINNEYGHFLNIIHKELKTIPTALIFDRSHSAPIFCGNTIPESSGSYRVSNESIHVYHLKESFLMRPCGSK